MPANNPAEAVSTKAASCPVCPGTVFSYQPTDVPYYTLTSSGDYASPTVSTVEPTCATCHGTVIICEPTKAAGMRFGQAKENGPYMTLAPAHPGEQATVGPPDFQADMTTLTLPNAQPGDPIVTLTPPGKDQSPICVVGNPDHLANPTVTLPGAEPDAPLMTLPPMVPGSRPLVVKGNAENLRGQPPVAIAGGSVPVPTQVLNNVKAPVVVVQPTDVLVVYPVPVNTGEHDTGDYPPPGGYPVHDVNNGNYPPPGGGYPVPDVNTGKHDTGDYPPPGGYPVHDANNGDYTPPGGYPVHDANNGDYTPPGGYPVHNANNGDYPPPGGYPVHDANNGDYTPPGGYPVHDANNGDYTPPGGYPVHNANNGDYPPPGGYPVHDANNGDYTPPGGYPVHDANNGDYTPPGGYPVHNANNGDYPPPGGYPVHDANNGDYTPPGGYPVHDPLTFPRLGIKEDIHVTSTGTHGCHGCIVTGDIDSVDSTVSDVDWAQGSLGKRTEADTNDYPGYESPPLTSVESETHITSTETHGCQGCIIIGDINSIDGTVSDVDSGLRDLDKRPEADFEDYPGYGPSPLTSIESKVHITSAETEDCDGCIVIGDVDSVRGTVDDVDSSLSGVFKRAEADSEHYPGYRTSIESEVHITSAETEGCDGCIVIGDVDSVGGTVDDVDAPLSGFFKRAEADSQ
ncbi:hypothetical protein G6O67_004282 [Ophiocordyceps sinensis]|nr:hypothetical protein G6O67_004282 [Ophiocordyceps sinensis]